jgi:signal transduction histidine kinase
MMQQLFSGRPKLLTSAAIFAAALLVLGAAGLALVQDSLHRAERQRLVSAEASVLAASIATALSREDQHAAQESVDALKENPDVEAAAIFGPNGKILARFIRDGAQPITRATAPAMAQENGQFAVSVPALRNGLPLGAVYLRTIREPVWSYWARYFPILLLASMSAMLIAILARAQSSLAQTNSRLMIEMEERARAEEALRHSQKMEAIGQLSGGIAHDFNNLLSVILGNLQMVKRRLARGRTDVLSYADMAIEALQRATSLTQRLLAFSRRQPLNPKPVELSKLVQEVLDLVNHLVGQQITITTELDATWWTVCDVNQMENVIINMAINARDAMPDGGVLRLATRDIHSEGRWRDGGVPAGDYVEVRISDNGTGMSEEVLRRAIDPFFTTKPTGKGTGLGLSVTFGYIQQSNGHLRIESEAGRGTTILILMPRVKVETSDIVQEVAA